MSSNQQIVIPSVSNVNQIPTQEFRFAQKPPINQNCSRDWKRIDVVTNFLRVNFDQTDRRVWEYAIEFPNANFNEDDQKKKAIKLLLPQIRQRYSNFKLAGCNFFSLANVRENVEFIVQIAEVDIKCVIKNTNHFIDLRNVNQNEREFNQDVKCFFEKLIKHIILSNKKMLRIRDQYYDIRNMKKLEEKSYMLSGFSTGFRNTECGFLLNVNIKNKIINGESCLDKLKDLKKRYSENGQEFRFEAQNYFKDLTVLTSYGSPRTYKLKGVDFDRNITNTTIKIISTSEDIKLIEYYQRNYPELEIKEKNQPLLVVEKKMSDESTQEIYLIPQLCQLTGMEEKSTESRSNMSRQTRIRPNGKMEQIEGFLRLIDNSERKTKRKNGEEIALDAPKTVADNWGIKFDGFKKTTARIIPPPIINFASKNIY